MLILTRRTGEKLVIGDEVAVTVLAIKGGQVRLGIDAPRDIAIHREEVIERDAAAQQRHVETVATEEDPRQAIKSVTKWGFKSDSSGN